MLTRTLVLSAALLTVGTTGLGRRRRKLELSALSP